MFDSLDNSSVALLRMKSAWASIRYLEGRIQYQWFGASGFWNLNKQKGEV
jgi:hypothetical protein